MTINGNKTIILPEGQLIELNIDEEISKNKVQCKLCDTYVNAGYHSRRSHVIENHYNKIQSLFNSKKLQSMKYFIDCISKTIKICFNNSLVKHDNQCVKCGNYYNNKQLMVNHVIIAHPIKIIGVVCTYPNCHYFSPTLKDILRHRQNHIEINQNSFVNDIPSDVPTTEIYKKITKYFFPFYHILNGNFNEPDNISKSLPKIINRKRPQALIEE
uniref:C2H2-type domain-containing protein n=1 Tax=Strongyloides papillosus TaxID=174720 RepID=A0A0N5C9J5_STREA